MPIDVHTHCDAQVAWAVRLLPSAARGANRRRPLTGRNPKPMPNTMPLPGLDG